MADKKTVEVTTPYERTVHWFLAVSCLLLVLTGLIIAFKTFGGDFLGGYRSVLWIHRILGLVFSVSLILAIKIWYKDAGSLDASDKDWLMVAGGYLWDAKVPEPYKYNAGQKLFFLAVACYGLIMVVTGLVLWAGKGALNPSFMRWMAVLHAFGVMVVGGFSMVHIYLGTIGTTGSAGAMLDGKVTEAWAKTHMAGWYKETKGKRKK
jgi:formate dehydrogenase subunit gamma